MFNRSRARIFAGAVGVVLLLVPVACGGSEEPVETQATATGAAEQATGLTEEYYHTPLQCDHTETSDSLLAYKVPKANEPYTIDFMQVSLAAYYYQAMAYGAEAAAKEAGVTVRHTAGEGYTGPADQLQDAENILQRGTDAIILAPVDTQGSVAVVDAADEAGVPVVNVSTEVADPRVYMVMQDDYLMGKAAADAVHELVPDGGPGIVMAGPANATWSKKRAIGFADQVAEKYPEIEIAAAPNQLVDPEEGLSDFENAVASNPDIKWVYATHHVLLLPDTIPPEYADVPYVTTDFTPLSAPAVESGAIDALLPVSPYWMGYVGLGTAVAKLNGEEPPRINCIPFPAITPENINEPWVQAELRTPADFSAEVG